MTAPAPWKVSLHGGHSRGYCDHAHDPLRAMLDAAERFGYRTFGVTEHAPRFGEQYLYEDEKAWGWTVEKLERDFEAYARDVDALSREFEGQLEVLRGFEIEVVPRDRYVSIMQGYRERAEFDYIVGSVHFLYDVPIDGPPDLFQKAVESAGGLEALVIAYYVAVRAMVEAMRPEVVGHLDVIAKNGQHFGPVESPAIRDAAIGALEAVRDTGGILDLNTAGYRKGLPTPYPAPWLLNLAIEMGVPLCFGDDSHSVEDVGRGIDDARAYLSHHGVTSITGLTRRDGRVVRETIPLNA